MRVHLTELAEGQINQTGEYILREFGRNKQLKFRRKIRHNIRLLSQHPHLGPLEPLLAHRKQMYRSLIVPPYNKFIYFITDDTIEIAAVWDTRRAPENLIAEVK